ncbi:hypothetical protein SAMN05421807_10360 [Virgibacillus chiguensis]|uniref:Uncharacterized protein n=1 Tax=Virgibacillus chiguensis TaxID=411959 RepID=A0A1M5PGN6_9BACI|nr:hypothetical protein SAMN05421807_10360 [Virgibacillus chiguensis]
MNMVYRRFFYICSITLFCTISFGWLDRPNHSYAAILHEWKQKSSDINYIHTGSHEFTYWKNFMRHKRTCHISQKIKTTVYYCDLHNHTKSKTVHVETVHSEQHS